MTSSAFDSSISPTQNQSSPFSISDILSKEKIGQKRLSPTSSYSIPFSTPGSNGVSKTPMPPMFGQENANRIKSGGSTETPKRPRKSSSSHIPARHPKISLSEAGTMVISSSAQTYAGHHDNLVAQAPYRPQMVTPHKPPRSSQITPSLVSPFNANVLLALGQRPSPSSEEKEELFGENSLGMLSEVAQYHSELSEAEANANSSLEAPVREKLANIRLVTSSDCSDMAHEASKGEARNASLIVRSRKASTPSILKRDKKRKRVLSAPNSSSGDESSGISSKCHPAHLDTGFLSPLADGKSSTSKDVTFSPSIFLSRPNHSHSTYSPTSSVPKEAVTTTMTDASCSSSMRFSTSPGSESDCMHSLSDTPDKESGSFVTSTPIKGGKENIVRSDSDEPWSPTILLTKRRRHLKEANEASSGSESDAVKRPCLRVPRRKTKARTKLSPLLENACSPISKDSSAQLHPSPLTTALVTTPTPEREHVAVSLSYQQPPLNISSAPLGSSISQPNPPPPPHPTFIGNSLLAASVSRNIPLGQKLLSTATSPITLTRPFPTAASAIIPFSTTQIAQTHQNLFLQQQQNALSRLQASIAYNPLVSVCSNSALQGYGSIIPNTTAGIQGYFPFVSLVAPPNPASYLSYNNPYTTDAHVMSMNSSYNNSRGRGNCSRVVLDESRRDSKHMRSVPPWFIFSNNRSEKRSRLTEAINKSLSETPSQTTTKLPAEWTKLACGQTNDQKQLTEKARIFLQCRPRQLTFGDENMG